jgi:tetratricopeptide (TPR) repeat protein
VYESVRSAFPAGEHRSSIGSWNCLLGTMEALYVAGLRDEAAELAPRMAEAQALGPEWIAFDGRLLGTRAGVAAAALGRWDDAERYFTEALDHAQGMPSELEAADVRRLHARVLLDRGRPEDAARAVDLLGRAAEAYGEFGMPGFVAEVEGLLSATSRTT